eukprot:scaffold2196_cov99-Cylindrotheca_fusiformis.AAC.2
MAVQHFLLRICFPGTKFFGAFKTWFAGVFSFRKRIEQAYTRNPSSLNLSMLMKAFNIPCTVVVGSVTRTDNKLPQGRIVLIKRVCMVALQTTFPFFIVTIVAVDGSNSKRRLRFPIVTCTRAFSPRSSIRHTETKTPCSKS